MKNRPSGWVKFACNFCVLFAFSAWAMAAADRDLIYTFDFTPPRITGVDGYDRVTMEECEQWHKTGEPLLPFKGVALLLPQGKEAANVTCKMGEEVALPGEYSVEPAQEPYPLSRPDLMRKTLPDPAIYKSSSPYPPRALDSINPQMKDGYRILFVNLHPTQYIPAEGRLSYFKTITVRVEFEESPLLGVGETPPRDLESDRKEIRRLVCNPGVMDSYRKFPREMETSVSPAAGEWAHLIITNQALEGSFAALRDHRIARGLNSRIVTTEWIYANYGGADNPAKIRNFIKDAYRTWDTQYVLLGGYSGIIPVKTLNADGENIPADMYYGCLDDGAQQDLTYEAHIGRAAVENATEARNFTNKTIAYETNDDSYRRKACMIGEYLGFGGDSEYATKSMEEIRLGSSAHGYTTAGFASNNWFDTSNNLYDSEAGNWPSSNLINLINDNAHVLNHLGHANYTYDMKLYTSQLSSLHNSKPFFGYSQGCMPGGFDASNCWAEVITTMQYGAFAFVGNSRYGWGRYNSTDGPSQRYDRPFWHALFKEDIAELGRMNAYSKEYNIYRIEESCMRWCYYELNLFGDPAVWINAEGVGPRPLFAAWQMFRNDTRRTGKSSGGGTTVPTLAWSYRADDCVSSSAAVSGTGTVYVGSEDNAFYSLSSTGALLWSYETTEPILSSPATSADTVYAGSDDNRVYCIIDCAGVLSWSYETGADVSSSPALSGTGTVYVGSEDGIFYSLSSAGMLLWSYEISEPILSSPAISTATVYVGSGDNRIYCVSDWTGALSWSYETGGDVFSSPALSGTGTVYLGSEDGMLYSLRSIGTLLWSYAAAEPIFSSPAISTDTVYVGSDDNRICLIIDRTGKLSWSYETGGDILSSPALSGTDTAYVGSEDGSLYSLNSNGSLAWIYSTGGPIESSIAICTDTVYVGSNDNTMYAFVEMTPTITPTPMITPTTTITPPPTGTPTTTPMPPIAVEPGKLTAGQTFAVQLALEEKITQPFDFYLLAETPAGIYTIYLNGMIRKGLTPLYQNVPGFDAPFSATVRSAANIPPSMAGKTLIFYAIVVNAGKIPPVKRLSELTPETPYVIIMDKKMSVVAP